MRLTVDISNTVADHLLSDEHDPKVVCFFAEPITGAVARAVKELRAAVVTGCVHVYGDGSVCDAEPEHHGANGLDHDFEGA